MDICGTGPRCIGQTSELLLRREEVRKGEGDLHQASEPSYRRRIVFLSLAATCDQCEWMHLHSPGKSP